MPLYLKLHYFYQVFVYIPYFYLLLTFICFNFHVIYNLLIIDLTPAMFKKILYRPQVNFISLKTILFLKPSYI
jgi:hypothetical protein